MDGRISNARQIAGIRRYTVTEGAEKGLDILDCDTGRIRFLLNVSKACDVMQLYHKGQNVSFLSKNGFQKRELPFLNRFEGGMLYTCGLDSVGGREGYELHGSFHTTPAEIVRAECDETGICVEALIRNTALFGKNLVMRRCIRAEIGGESIMLKDSLHNESFRDEEYCLLYHINVGYPMLDAGARLVADVERCEARTAWSAEHADTVREMGLPVPNQEEMCYFLRLKTPEVALVNEGIGKTLTISYSQDTLPYFVEWKSMTSGDYALGLEPCTTELDDRFSYRTIAPDQTVEFSVNITVKDQTGGIE